MFSMVSFGIFNILVYYQYMHDIQSKLRNEIKLKSNINVSENLHPKDNVNYVLRKPI